MHFGTQVTNDNVSWDTLKRIALAVDGGSWNSLWNYDHLIPPLGEMMPHLTKGDPVGYENGDTFEGYTMLAAWAALTSRVKLGCLVTAIPFRNPALLAKMAVTIDHISNGRFELGVGAAWHQRETEAYGIQLGPVKERLDRFEDALKVISGLLSPGTRHDYTGSFFQLKDAPFAPGPVNKKLPILIGGGGEKRTLRLVAEYADSYNFFGNFLSSKEDYIRKNELLDEHCAAVGRNPKEIRRTMCLFANIEPDDAKAKATREFMGQHLPQENRDNILFGTASRIVDGTGKFMDLGIDEILFCGLTNEPEVYQQFDKEVLQALQPVAVR